MILQKYDINLIRLEQENLEMLRQWRNAPEIVRNMEYQEYITAEMQQKWFGIIDNICHFYFLIQHENNWVGLIHLSDIDFKVKTAKAGIFISNQSYINTSIPAHASFALLDFSFAHLGLKTIRIKVNKNNKKALKYNQHLGFLYTAESKNTNFIFMRLSHKNYEEKTTRIRKILLANPTNPEQIIFNEHSEIDQEIKNRFF